MAEGSTAIGPSLLNTELSGNKAAESVPIR